MNIPKRITLRSQCAELIRQHLREGIWTGPLPGEQNIAEQFQVSRVTIRLALADLRREGVIELFRHRHRLTKANPDAVKKSRLPMHRPFRVSYLCSQPLGDVMLRKMGEIYNLQRLLQEHSVQLTLITESQLARQQKPEPRLKKITIENRSDCWVLGLCPAPVQRWFAQQRIPAIISGSSHEGVDLPFIDWDHRAIGRHAAGLLRSRSHHQIVLLTPERLFAGDLESEAGFFEVSARVGPADPAPLVLRHDGTTGTIRALIHKVFTRDSHPTALASLHALDAMTAMTCMQANGFRIPGDIAMISLQGEPFLDRLLPSIAHYEWRSTLQVKHLFRAILNILAGKSTPKSELLIGRFCPGDSLGPARSSARSTL